MAPGTSGWGSPDSAPPTRRHRHRARWIAGTVATVAALTLATSGAVASAGPPPSRVAAPAALTAPAAPAPAAAPAASELNRGDVIANLWEWNWNSIAKECTDVLGPKGYGGVQVAPPADSLKRTALGDGSDTVLHPWWEVYQPARYVLSSRMGTEAQFRTMVTTCRDAGVKVYVDAVINHMTGQGTQSYGGTTYSKYEYDNLFGPNTTNYSPNNFHKSTNQCPSSDGGIQNFNDRTQLVNCELVGLSDLRTDTGYVRNQLVRYLNKLLGYGVSGFRVDAAKHLPQADLIAIRDRLRDTVDGDRPYWVLEVGFGSPGISSPTAYLRAGDLLGFDYEKQIKDAFKSYTTPAIGAISTLKVFGEDAGLLPSDRSLVFIHNHDSERGNETVNWRDGKTNIIAHQFMLAYPYGTPQVYSAYTWDTDTAQSPPATADGLITDTDCSTGSRWTCVDRTTGVANLVGWHNHVGNARLRNWYDDGRNFISFSRGRKGWIAINNGGTAVTQRFQTRLPAGTYCDVSHANFTGGACSGATITVNAAGTARVTVRSKEAVAIGTHARVS